MDSVERAVVQLFVYHDQERIYWITAPQGSGKTNAVRLWLDSAGDAVDQLWLNSPTVETIRSLPPQPDRPTFVVLRDYQPQEATNAALIETATFGTIALSRRDD